METKDYGLVDLDVKSQTEINAGNPIAIVIGVLGAVIYLYNNSDDFIKGFKEGFESTQKK